MKEFTAFQLTDKKENTLNKKFDDSIPILSDSEYFEMIKQLEIIGYKNEEEETIDYEDKIFYNTSLDLPSKLPYYVVNQTDVKYPPYNSAGTVRAEIDADYNRFGSGSALSPYLIITAAHNISMRKDHVFDIIWFTPNHPFKQRKYYVDKVFIMSQYNETQHKHYDVALLLLKEPLDLISYFGLKTNVLVHSRYKKDYLNWYTLAYPSALPFNEQDKLILDWGKASDRAFQFGNVYNQIGFQAWENYDLSRGASGGPWILNSYRTERIGSRLLPGYHNGVMNSNYVNGVVSFVLSSKPGCIYSPLFTDEHKNFFLNVFNEIRNNNNNKYHLLDR